MQFASVRVPPAGPALLYMAIHELDEEGKTWMRSKGRGFSVTLVLTAAIGGMKSIWMTELKSGTAIRERAP